VDINLKLISQTADNMAEKQKLIKKRVDKRETSTKLERLIEYLQNGECSKFTGYIKINFSQGHIGRIEKFEEILRK
jgi:hypothetical protein